MFVVSCELHCTRKTLHAKFCSLPSARFIWHVCCSGTSWLSAPHNHAPLYRKSAPIPVPVFYCLLSRGLLQSTADTVSVDAAGRFVRQSKRHYLRLPSSATAAVSCYGAQSRLSSPRVPSSVDCQFCCTDGLLCPPDKGIPVVQLDSNSTYANVFGVFVGLSPVAHSK